MTLAVANDSRLGKTTSLSTLVSSSLLLPLGVVGTHVPTLETGAVDCREFHPTLHQLVLHSTVDRLVQESLGPTRAEQPVVRLLKGGEVWNCLQPDRSCQCWRVGQQGREFAIIQPQKLLEHQAGEQLWLRKLLGTEQVGIDTQTPLANAVRGQ